MERWKGKIAVVTGSAFGIGCLEAVDNTENRINGYYPLRCDVSREEDVDAAFSFVERTLGGIDIMVNNAGVTDYTRVIESDRRAFERLLNINVLAVAVCINRAVRSMRERNVEGHVFNINSVLGHEIPSGYLSDADGCNGWNLYPTCKHGTVALTHTVRRELCAIKAPIRITSISPGLVKTRIAKDAPYVEDLLEKMPMLLPQDVADALLYALGTRPEVQITQLTIQVTGEP
ncbi:hypothetical protein KPH14_010328 [Odynerus spinipes]|uniref:Dehydrogenase/reductase SDR family member 11 n=1 Tax=Odynerus spinipes TaxID=1348599 RepID=A0AAD9RU84_9HYME|nr:hypothetical protein KPH14_010328 [Odynerus spinipes]